jgi:hypothetical protein
MGTSGDKNGDEEWSVAAGRRGVEGERGEIAARALAPAQLAAAIERRADLLY